MTEPVVRLAAALADRYRIERELGRGGMATVYLAQDLKHERPVAIKVLRPELAASLGPERFLREIHLTARLQHPNILPLLDSGSVGPEAQEGGPQRAAAAAGSAEPPSRRAAEYLYYVMPYVEGESLADRLKREKQLPLDEALRIAHEVADALGYAHGRGVIHRDIKPDNILLAGGHARVADFGIARAVDAAGGPGLTETGLAVGTAQYMSPEQAAAEKDLDGRTDLYSLGCVLYEMLAGGPPFTGPSSQAVMARHAMDPVPSLRTVRRTVPEAVEAAIVKAMAKVPADRWASAEQFAVALTATSGPSRARARTWAVRWTAAVTLVLGGLLLWLRARVDHGSVLQAANVIAVLPPEPQGPDTALTRLGRDLAATVSASLDGVGDIRTVDRLSLLARTRRSPAGLTPAAAAAVARQFGATSLVHGILAREGNRVRLDLTLFTSDSLLPLAQISYAASPESLTAMTDTVTWRLLHAVWRRGKPPVQSLEALTTRSVAALRAYLDGERELVGDNWGKAEQAFQEAVAADSAFWWARMRLAMAKAWINHEPDSASLAIVAAHLAQLPERERLLAQAWLGRSRTERSIELARELTERFPDFWPGWLEYADRLFHDGPLLGHPGREALEAFEATLKVNPDLVPVLDHLNFIAGIVFDTAAFAWSLEEMERHQFDEVRVLRAVRLAMSGTTSGPLFDSLVTEWADRRSKVPYEDYMGIGFSRNGFPGLQVAMSGRVLQHSLPPSRELTHRMGLVLAWAARGNWDSALSAEARFEEAAADDTATADAHRLRVLGAWLGVIDPGEADRRREAVGRILPRLSPTWQVEVAWLDGLTAWLKRDSEAMTRAQAALRGSADSSAWVVSRSLAAFALDLGGARRAAAESLAALEYQRLAKPWGGEFRHPYLIGINRLAAARWLAEAGDTTAAERLLVWFQAVVPDVPYDYSAVRYEGLTYLEMARLAEGRKRYDQAREDYAAFLRRFDAPDRRNEPLQAEARAALARLTPEALERRE
jgi:TolB-like protein